MQSIAYELIYYIYVLLFGVYVSMKIACGALSRREWQIFGGLCPVLLALQGLCLLLWDIDRVRLLYPLITHLPTMLAFVLLLRVKWSAALVSVVASYSMCQLLRWIGLVIYAFDPAPLAAIILHLACSQLLCLLLDGHCLDAIHSLVKSSPRLLSCFGVLPILYYLYEYFMLFTQRRYARILAFDELLPTEMVLFFILFVIAYQRETQRREQAEDQTAALEMKLTQAEHEIAMLRVIQEQTAIYRHDLHHHLMMIGSLLSAGRQDQAKVYIRKAESEIEAIAPMRYCENETANLLLGAFKGRADARGVTMTVKASLPEELNLPDTELCALLSNGLENAMNAVFLLPEGAPRTIDIFCGVKQNKLLLEIKNPYHGKIAMANGLPQSQSRERRYGCRSIQSIVQRRQGVCAFDASSGIFILQIAIPLKG